MKIDKGPQASYIIPFRGGDKVREENLHAVIDWVMTLGGIEIVLVEQSAAPSLEHLAEENISYVFQLEEGSFNKSRALNQGAEIAAGDVLVMADADMIIDHQALTLSIEACRDHVDAVNPYSNLVDLSEQQRQAFLQSRELPEKEKLVPSARQQEGEQLCFCGGIYLMKKAVYHAVGGMDEAFKGWGGEDDAMSIKLTTLSVSQLIKHSQIAYHLWHQRDATERYQHPNYQANHALLKRYTNMNRQTLLEYLDLNKH